MSNKNIHFSVKISIFVKEYLLKKKNCRVPLLSKRIF